MTTYTKFSLAAKIRLHENFTSEIFYWRKYPDLRYGVKLRGIIIQCLIELHGAEMEKERGRGL